MVSVEPYTSYRPDDGSTLRQLISFPNERDKNESSEIDSGDYCFISFRDYFTFPSRFDKFMWFRRLGKLYRFIAFFHIQ